ncbi:polysaccharide deacetylase family protein [Phyllobacterium zundukense]|uniref:Polysaccharide deacetylase n=1 Tax=Phyllobacterium zundukense TaxID=1867719 RepID=A0ACD4CUY0_9HYPH|nr:polysaccharide deacetylase [Phyllobacterium zundukense]UXN57400.1 polysaccharide deacetylase [Phyllobacterium zundukense]
MLLNPILWPNGKKFGASVTFDIDADTLLRLACPNDSDRRLSALSVARYEPTVAVPRVLETYRRLNLRQTFFIPGQVMADNEAMVEAILEGGHEIGHHSWAHESPLDHSDEREEELFGRALETHLRLTGRKPRGYRAPIYGITPAIIDRLIREGFVYDSSLMADDLPYSLETKRGSLIEIPAHWGTDDWPPFAHMEEQHYVMPVRSPSAGMANFFEELDAAREVGGFWMPVLHPFLTGRLARWRLMEKQLEALLEKGDVWIAPMEEIAKHALSQHKLRVEPLT